MVCLCVYDCDKICCKFMSTAVQLCEFVFMHEVKSQEKIVIGSRQLCARMSDREVCVLYSQFPHEGEWSVHG